MTPEQRAQLQGLAEQLLEDMDLRWQVDQLAQNLRSAFPGAGWERRFDFSGSDPLGFAEAADIMRDLGDLDQLEQLLRSASNPGALAEVDLDRARTLLGDDAALSLDRMSQVAKMLEDAGLIEHREGRYELTPKGIRRIGQNALAELFARLTKDATGRHEVERLGAGNEWARRSRTCSAIPSTSTSSAPCATASSGPVGARRSRCCPRTSRWRRPRRSPARPRC
jgi:uncharacterized protein with von Willebrand factor type A (vWA) domain